MTAFCKNVPNNRGEVDCSRILKKLRLYAAARNPLSGAGRCAHRRYSADSAAQVAASCASRAARHASVSTSRAHGYPRATAASPYIIG